MVDVSTERLNAASQSTYKVDYPMGMRLASGLNLDPNGICQALYQKDLNACYTELLGDGTLGSPGLLSSHALLLDGTTGCWCTTPDNAVLDIVADIDMRIEYTQFPGGGVNQSIMGKWTPTGNQRSYRMHLTFGFASIWWSTTGADELTDGQDFPPAAHRELRTVLDVVNGANRVSDYFSAPSGLGLGTNFGTHTVAGNTSIFSSSAVLGIGAVDGGTASPFKGRVYRAEVRNGIDGSVVANPDFRNLTTGTTSFADASGRTWTLQGTARIV